MKLTIPRAALHAALTQARRVVERRNTIPVLSNVHLATDGDTLRITATDLDVETRVRVAATIEQPGATTVPAHLLADLIGKMEEGTIAIDELADGATVEVRGGRARARLQCLPVADYPAMSDGEPTHRFAVATADLIEAIESTQLAISTEETRYYLNGVLLHGVGDRLVIVATDGHRLLRWRGPLPDGAAGSPGVIVPRKTVGEILRIAKEAAKDGDDLVSIGLSEALIRFEIGDTVLTSKLIDGTFPDYGRVIPEGHEAEVAIDGTGLAEAVGRVTTISSERGRAVKLTFAEAVLRLEVVNPDSGSASEELPVTMVAGETSLAIGFNARYLGDVVTALAADTIVARLPGDAGSPTVFVPRPAERDGRDRLAVVMPMRV